MELTTKWRKKHRRAGSDDDVDDDSQPIDSQEQEEMVRSFEREHARRSRMWRRVFAGFLLGYNAFMLYSIFRQAWYPWELVLGLVGVIAMKALYDTISGMPPSISITVIYQFVLVLNLDLSSRLVLVLNVERFHAYFMEEMQSWMVISADLVAVLACSFAVKGVVNSSKSPQQWMWYSCYISLLLAIFWLFYMFRLPKFRWDAVWLPLGPLSGAAICLYVDHLLRESLEDVKLLRSYMYNFKSL